MGCLKYVKKEGITLITLITPNSNEKKIKK